MPHTDPITAYLNFLTPTMRLFLVTRASTDMDKKALERCGIPKSTLMNWKQDNTGFRAVYEEVVSKTHAGPKIILGHMLLERVGVATVLIDQYMELTPDQIALMSASEAAVYRDRAKFALDYLGTVQKTVLGQNTRPQRAMPDGQDHEDEVRALTMSAIKGNGVKRG